MGKRILLILLIAAGCSDKLESGYEPQKLNMSIAERKALYADPYSQQAQEAQEDQEKGGSGSEMHTPGTY